MKETIIFSTDIDPSSKETMFEINATIEYEDGELGRGIYIGDIEINSIKREDNNEEINIRTLNINVIEYIEFIVSEYFKEHVGELNP